ncbi:MAG: hypothetical protein ACOCUY_02325 [Verrucomicrobiota bacterium]
MSAETVRQMQRRAVLSLVVVIGVLFVTGFGDLYGEVSQAHRSGQLRRTCRTDWNDSLLNGVPVGTEEQWHRVLRNNPELLLRACSTNAGIE